MAYRALRRLRAKAKDGAVREYTRGMIISDYVQNDMATLEALGYVESVDKAGRPPKVTRDAQKKSAAVSSTTKVAGNDDEPASSAPEFDLALLDQSVKNLTADLEDIDDPDHLQALLEAEESGKTRAGAVKAIEARAQELAE